MLITNKQFREHPHYARHLLNPEYDTGSDLRAFILLEQQILSRYLATFFLFVWVALLHFFLASGRSSLGSCQSLVNLVKDFVLISKKGQILWYDKWGLILFSPSCFTCFHSCPVFSWDFLWSLWTGYDSPQSGCVSQVPSASTAGCS